MEISLTKKHMNYDCNVIIFFMPISAKNVLPSISAVSLKKSENVYRVKTLET